MWACLGHRVRDLDVNEPLIKLARERAQADGLGVAVEVGTATSLPWPDASVDICLVPQLFEHVGDWQSCVMEAARVLRPGGLLYISTTNYLCPLQDELNLPLYSWYPAPLKRYHERLAVTTRPELANYPKYPAVHWFSFYMLRAFLKRLTFTCFDRFDLVDPIRTSRLRKVLLAAVMSNPVLRFAGQICTTTTYLIGRKATGER